MIALVRVRTATAIHPNFRGAQRVANNLHLLKKKLAGELDSAMSGIWDSSIWKAAKGQLLEESAGKCAYCESPTSVVAFGDVEHFRPKSRYWWLGYCLENYLPACIICNQKFKQDHFELKASGKAWTGPVVRKSMKAAQLLEIATRMTVDPLNDGEGQPLKDFIKTTKAEKPLIIDPYIQNPADYFAYKPVLSTREVLVVPLKPAHKAVVSACDKYYGINRKELRDERFRHYATYMTYRQTLAVSGIPAKLRKSVSRRLTEMAAGSLRYTGMIRYLDTRSLEDLPWDFDL
jgi:hypothetical protein